MSTPPDHALCCVAASAVQKKGAPRGRAFFGTRCGAGRKPGSVVDSHSSRRIVTDTLKQPTRRHRGPRHCLPIWPCSRWGLPCRPVARLAVRSYRTISPLPAFHLACRRVGTLCRTFVRQVPRRTAGGIFLLHFPSARAAQALPGTVPCGARTFLGIPRTG